jgi:hypothetical protein
MRDKYLPIINPTLSQNIQKNWYWHITVVFPERKFLKVEITATKGSSLILKFFFPNNQSKLVVL